MLLSVIIVNYNVKHFLEQCLYSLQEAMEGMDGEIIVTDNNSSDGSLPYLHNIFPTVYFIKNTVNAGFAKANNQALEYAKGEYVLFLNPDTLVPKDALKKVIAYLSSNGNCGALGLRMIDGSGRFLPESKRAFPSPLTSLFKLAGLASIFPESKWFARYHLGHLPDTENHQVDVLAGAFMLVRKNVLDAAGSFDESFFMYGEDIDLSYRIQQAGWTNHYFAETTIIHFKGESTKKGSLNYVRMFYQAMNQFVDKHYGSGKASLFKFFISIAIWIRAFISAAARFIKWVGLPFFDILVTIGSIGLVALFWQHYIKPGIHYPPRVLWTIIPLFSLVFVLAGGLAGLYEKWYRPSSAWIAMMIAIVVNLAIYSLLDIDYRFSRGVILLGGILASTGILLLRFFLLKTGILTVMDEKKEERQTLICGSLPSFLQVTMMMKNAGRRERILGRVATSANTENSSGHFNELDSLLQTIPAREIIFCIDEEFSLQQAIVFMQAKRRRVRYKFFYKKSSSIIGSESSETSGETLSAVELFTISHPEKRRYKRITDLVASMALLLLLPVNIFLVQNFMGFAKNIFMVMFNRKTWVGYCVLPNALPALPPAVLGCNGLPQVSANHKNESLQRIDYWYAKDYHWKNDLRIMLAGYRYLGSQP